MSLLGTIVGNVCPEWNHRERQRNQIQACLTQHLPVHFRRCPGNKGQSRTNIQIKGDQSNMITKCNMYFYIDFWVRFLFLME